MKKIKVSLLKDNARFKISEKSNVCYSVQKKGKGCVIATSLVSGRTYSIPSKKLVFVK